MAQNDRRSSRTPGTGFLGATSFSAIYDEDRSLRSLHGSPEKCDSIESGLNRQTPAIRDVQIKQAVFCLSLLRDMPVYELFIEKWLTPSVMSMTQPWVKVCQSSLKIEIYQHLVNSPLGDTESLLAAFSSKIFDNTLKPMDLWRNCTTDEFTRLFTGEQTRWETVGIYLTVVGLAVITMDNLGPNFSQEWRYDQAKRMLHGSDICLSFCQEAGQLTDLETWHALENTHLSTLVEGDAGNQVWRRLGDFISTCVSKGLHSEIEVSHDVPFWLSEMRKRTFAVAYNMDKSTSSFLGRPPRLQRRYCAMQLPLDIGLDNLRLPAPQLEELVNKLDDQGWNTEGRMDCNSFSRTQLICNLVTEDILEFALASLPRNDMGTAQDIMRRSQDAWNSLPLFIKQSNRGTQGSDFNANSCVPVHLDFRLNEFLLQRAMVKRLHAPEDELIRLSREILSTVLVTLQHNSSGRNLIDMPWMIAKYGLPSAGVLGLELLRQSQSRMRLASSSHRSEIVQNLSGLLAALKWAVSKRDGNYEICNQARHVLQRILDIVLDPDQSFPDAAVVDHGRDSAVYDYSWSNKATSEVDFWSMLPDHPLLADSRPR